MITDDQVLARAKTFSAAIFRRAQRLRYLSRLFSSQVPPLLIAFVKAVFNASQSGKDSFLELKKKDITDEAEVGHVIKLFKTENAEMAIATSMAALFAG